MQAVRCPECKLNLSGEEGEAAGWLWCPGCGTVFLIDRATGVITVYYEEATDSPTEAPLLANPQEETGAPSTLPGYVDLAAADQREARANREARGRWRLYFSLLFIAAGCAFGAFKAVTAPERDREDILLRTLILAPAGGLILGLFLASLIFSDTRVTSRWWLFGGKTGPPDFDEIAERLKEGMIRRRPLPSSETGPPAPPDAPGSNDPRLISANEGQLGPIMAPPPNPSLPGDPSNTATEDDPRPSAHEG